MAGHSNVLQVLGTLILRLPNCLPNCMQVLGTFILWLWWYGFNAGSTLAINTDTAKTAGRVVVVTTLSACTGGITSMSLEKMNECR